MAGIWGVIGQPHSVAITHYDGNESLYPVAYVYNHEDTLITTLDLVHQAKGYYSVCWEPAAEGVYNMVIICYDDNLHTVPNAQTQEEGRTYFINNLLGLIESMASDTAAAVWDELLPGVHDLPNSAGLFMQVIRETVLQTSWDVTEHASWGLPALEQKIMDTRTIVVNEVNENEIKIDDLSAEGVSHFLDIVNEVQLNRNAISAHDSHLSSVETNIIGEINENEIKLDTILANIQNIQNNTRFVGVVPQKMRIPDSGTNTYQFFLAIYDADGVAAAPDETPRVRVVTSAGTELLSFTAMTQDGTKVGQYYYDYAVTPSTQENILRVEFEVIEDLETAYLPRVSETIILDSDLSVIENKIDIIDANVDTVNSQLSGGNGLSVINDKLDGLEGDVNQNEAKLDQIKAKTDLIKADTATTSDLDALEAKIDAQPTISQIQDRLDTQTSSIKGLDNRNLTDVYDNERGTDNAVLQTDPRLAFLDIAISSRSNHSVSDIWSYGTRTLTGAAPISDAEIAKIWDYLVVNITTSGSIGKHIIDMLDTNISSMSTLTLAQLVNALSPLALEATLSEVNMNVINENNENQVLIQEILGVVDQIKPQTDKIVDDGARHDDLVQEIKENLTAIEGLNLLLDAVKAKTDYLHSDLAHQSSVEQIPTDPLLSTDGRLDNLYLLPRLDVNVSTRAESFPTDYAKAVALEDVKNDIIAEVNINEALLNQIPTGDEMDDKLIRIDNVLVGLDEIKGSNFDTLLHSLVKIKEGQGSSGPGTGASPQEIWEYAQRTLTEHPDFATPDDITDAKNAVVEALPTYRCNMTTTFITQSDVQEVLCWLDKDDQTVVGSNARIVVSDGSTDLWNGSDASPDSRGVFRVTPPNISALINESDRNFVITITIEYNGKDYTTTQPFYTVG